MVNPAQQTNIFRCFYRTFINKTTFIPNLDSGSLCGVKIGPAFFDYVSSEKIGRKKNFGNFVSFEILLLFPILFLILFSTIIILRLFYVQILRGEYYSKLSDQNRTRTEVLAAPRGIIYDRKGKPLVANSPSFKILEKKKVKRLSRDEALKLMSAGKNVENDTQREYLYKDVFAHVLGYLGQISEDEIILPGFSDYGISDFVGKIGLEAEYEKILHGKNGKKLSEVDSDGKIIRELGKQEPTSGENLRTTLDLDFQKAVHDAFSDYARGAAIVSDPRNGAILALYSKPSFDPNVFTHDERYEAPGEYKTRESILNDTERQPLLDRALSGSYPPGSTFKLITAIAGLESGAIKPSTIIEDTGILRVGSFSFGNWYFLQYGKTEGDLDVVRAIKRSNDIFFYRTGERTGVDTISSFAKKFGLGEKLGIDLPGETQGTVPSPSWKEKTIGEQWYLGDTYNYGIGQGYLLTTPLQINMMTAAFANRGTLYKPRLVENQKSEIKNQKFIDKKNIELVRQGMLESCQTGGVAWPLFDFKVKNERLPVDGKDFTEDDSTSSALLSASKMTKIKIACKTGTAETGDKETKPHAWITLFAPFYKPEIAITVLVENSGEGSSIAGPIAKKILTDYFEQK